ncbi:helix-turn-helix domain-containing protein [Acinetobacter radioresistens]|uniref:AraC family transcriptional regulator n=1 Tax=Acinetobacter radioresistens TaxID=40216 RepID=UPI003A80EC0B
MINKNVPLIPVRYYLKLVELLIARNIPIQVFLEELHIDIEQYLAQPDLKVSISQVEKIIQYCLRFPVNTDLAFELGRSLHLSSHSLVGYAILTSKTVEHALKLVTKYFSLIMPSFKASIYFNKNQQAEWLIEPELDMDQSVLNFHIEAIAIALHNNLNDLIDSPFLSFSIFLSLPEPPHLKQINQLKQVRFHFNALNRPSLKITLSQELLAYKLPLADEMTLKAVEFKCQEQMKEITQSQDFPEWIKMILLNTYQMPTLTECAELLHVSTKTLQRQLHRKNSDFNGIKKQVIILKAQERLIHSSASITQIAYELGYSSSSNFSRAFKALVGLTPEAYRQQFQ